MSDTPPPCRHIIRHAVTEEERERAIKALEYSRSMGDSTGTMFVLAQLSQCPNVARYEAERKESR